MLFNYKEKAESNKAKIIKNDVRKFKKLCLKEFRKNIKMGLDTTYVDFYPNVRFSFEDEISEIVLTELRREYKNIDFSFSFMHYHNSYKGIKMVAK